jgi:hypothetical protein
MPRALFLDVHCDPCHRLACRQCVEELRAEGRLGHARAQLAAGGDRRLREAPRRARFWCHSDTGEVGVEAFAAQGTTDGPSPPPFGHQPGGRAFPHGHRRPDGGWTWDLSCSHGHPRHVQHERVIAAFKSFPPGQDTWRIPL